jgi:hypothetical protein
MIKRSIRRGYGHRVITAMRHTIYQLDRGTETTLDHLPRCGAMRNCVAMKLFVGISPMIPLIIIE